jgi:signal transduction histidine kinase
MTRAVARDRAETQRTLRWLAIAGVAVLSIVTSTLFVAASSAPDRSFVHVLAYSISYLIAGSIAWVRRPDNRVGPVLLVIAALGAITFVGRVPGLGQLAGFAGTLGNILLTWVVLAAPSGQLSRGAARWLFVAFATLLVATNVITTFFFDLTVMRVLFAIGAALAVAIALVVLRRWFAASAAARRSLGPVVLAGVTISLVHALDLLSGVLLLQVTIGSPLYWADTLSRLLVPFGFLFGLLRLRMARGALADLVVDLGETPAPGRLREALAGALGDPSLEVQYWSPEADAYVDANGAAVDPVAQAGARSVSYLEHRGQPMAAILHDPALAEDPGLVAAVSAAVRLAVENERLTAEVEAQLREVRASRARIVAAGDAERRRVERDLHDGAQQRIVSMTLALRLAQAKLGTETNPAVRESLEQASAEAKAALSELRELARGIHPQILTEAGLAAAVDNLAARAPVAVTVDIDRATRWAPEVESTAYFVVSEALTNVTKYAHAHGAVVRAREAGGMLQVEISDDGVGGADAARGTGLRGLADRLAVVDGTLEVTSPPAGGTIVRARIPTAAPIPA